MHAQRVGRPVGRRARLRACGLWNRLGHLLGLSLPRSGRADAEARAGRRAPWLVGASSRELLDVACPLALSGEGPRREELSLGTCTALVDMLQTICDHRVEARCTVHRRGTPGNPAKAQRRRGLETLCNALRSAFHDPRLAASIALHPPTCTSPPFQLSVAAIGRVRRIVTAKVQPAAGIEAAQRTAAKKRAKWRLPGSPLSPPDTPAAPASVL